MSIPADDTKITNFLHGSGDSIGSPATVNETTNTNDKNSGLPYVNFKHILVCIVIPLILSAIYLLQNEENIHDEVTNPNKTMQDVYMEIKSSLKELRNEMSQSRDIWVQLGGQIKSVMVEKPSQPAVVVALVPQGAQRTASCIVEKVATLVVNAFQDNLKHIMYDMKLKTKEKDVTDLKMDLHEALKDLSTNKVAIIHNIELMQGHTASTFHAYCDNKNAPHKQAVLLLTMETPINYEDINEDGLDNLVDKQLMEKWSKDLRETDAAAIVSRMANAVILIKPEPEVILSKIC